MKKKYTLLIIIFAFCAVYCVSQEFIKPKNKKPSVSEQQNIELDGDLIMYTTQLSGALIDFSKAIFLITQAAVGRVNDYACGQRDSLCKAERAALYDKKMKIKEKIEDCREKIEQMIQSINALVALSAEA